MTPALIDALGFARDLLLIAGGAFFGAFAASGMAKRGTRRSVAKYDAIRREVLGLPAKRGRS